MSTIALGKDNFDKTVEEHELVVIDFSADWCEPCKAFEKIYEEVSKKYPDITFASIDADKEKELVKDFNVRSVPFVMIIRQSIVVFSEPGVMPAKALIELLEQTLKLDMDQIRGNIAEKEEG